MKEIKLEFRKLFTQLALNFAFWVCPEESNSNKVFKTKFAEFLIENLKNL
jgi:hypothetical protein